MVSAGLQRIRSCWVHPRVGGEGCSLVGVTPAGAGKEPSRSGTTTTVPGSTDLASNPTDPGAGVGALRAAAGTPWCMEPTHLPTPDTVADAAVWSMADVADFLRLDRRQVRRLLGTNPRFPQPQWISPRVCRFDANAVREWVRDGGSPTTALAPTTGRRIVERV